MSTESDPTPRALVLLLRAGGVLLSLAFVAVIMPTDTMAAIHAELGMGELPREPIVDYLTRSISALYGFHGVLLFVVANDVVRYRPIVVYLGGANLVLGAMLTAIDLQAGMPWWWTAGEGPPVVVIGAALLWLVRDVPRRP